MLDLNKKTVSHLSNQQLQQVSGGEEQICIASTKKVCAITITASATTKEPTK